MNRRLLALTLLGSISLTSMPLYAKTQPAEGQAVVSAKAQEDAQEKVQRTLWGAKISPYVRKALVTLEEKQVPYHLIEILPTKLLLATKQDVPEAFSKVSPLGKIPAYEETSSSDVSKKDSSFALSDSGVIMEYLDQTVRKNPLRPVCPKTNASVTWFSKYADDVLAPITHKVLIERVVKPGVLKETTDEAAVKKMLNEELPVVFDFLEKTLAEDKRTWIANSKNFSLADIAVVSHLVTLQTANLNLEELIGKNRPHLLNYVKKVLDRNSFKKVMM